MAWLGSVMRKLAVLVAGATGQLPPSMRASLGRVGRQAERGGSR